MRKWQKPNHSSKFQLSRMVAEPILGKNVPNLTCTFLMSIVILTRVSNVSEFMFQHWHRHSAQGVQGNSSETQSLYSSDHVARFGRF